MRLERWCSVYLTILLRFDASKNVRQLTFWGMFCRLYVEALLINAKLADEVWTLWNNGDLGDETAYIAWALIA